MITQIVAVALSAVGVAVALVLLLTGARGRRRVAGVTGAVLMLLGTLSGWAYQWVLGPMLGQVSDDTLVAVLSAETVIGSVLTAAGLILLTYAITATVERQP